MSRDNMLFFCILQNIYQETTSAVNDGQDGHGYLLSHRRYWYLFNTQ